MDYQFEIYPSSTIEYENVRSSNKTKSITSLQQEKHLKDVYKKKFGQAVKKYNNFVFTGKMIDNYLRAIEESNIPSVYMIDVIVRYNPSVKTDSVAIKKSFSAFNKALEKDENMEICAAYCLGYDDFLELQIYFVPISDGYATGLTTRNDLIDITRKIFGIKDNINILKAMPLFSEYIKNIWASVADSEIMSQEEYERKAKEKENSDAAVVHAVALKLLKEQMNNFQRITNDNSLLATQIEDEKTRIVTDLAWCRQKEKEIDEAEVKRIAEEKRKEEEKKRLEEEAHQRELQRLEEEKQKEIQRQEEIKRLEEQAKKNAALRETMNAKQQELQEKQLAVTKISKSYMNRLVETHKEWMKVFDIPLVVDLAKLPEDVLSDPRRMVIKNAKIIDFTSDTKETLVGASFEKCEFINCNINVNLGSSDITDCTFINSTVAESVFSHCYIKGIENDDIVINNVSLDMCDIKDSDFSYAEITALFSGEKTVFDHASFKETVFTNCDMKQNIFASCSFEGAVLTKCDFRNAEFSQCNFEYMINEKSSIKTMK